MTFFLIICLAVSYTWVGYRHSRRVSGLSDPLSKLCHYRTQTDTGSHVWAR